jgi:hypothetical protein
VADVEKDMEQIARSIREKAYFGEAPQKIEQLVNALGILGENAEATMDQVNNLQGTFKNLAEKELGIVDSEINRKFVKNLQKVITMTNAVGDATAKNFLKQKEFAARMQILEENIIKTKEKGLTQNLFGLQTFNLQTQKVMADMAAKVFGKDSSIARTMASEDSDLAQSLVALGGTIGGVALALKFAAERASFVALRTEDLGNAWATSGAQYEQMQMKIGERLVYQTAIANVFYDMVGAGNRLGFTQEQVSKLMSTAAENNIVVMARQMTAQKDMVMSGFNVIKNTQELTLAYSKAATILYNNGQNIAPLIKMGLAYGKVITPSEISALSTGLSSLSQQTTFSADIFINALSVVGEKLRGTGYSLGDSLRWVVPMMQNTVRFGKELGWTQDTMSKIVNSIVTMAGNVDTVQYMALGNLRGDFSDAYMKAGVTNPFQQLSTMARRLTSEAGGDMAKLDIMSKNFGMFSNLSNPKLRTQAMQFMAQLSPESAKAMQGKSFEDQARLMLKTSTAEEQNQLAMALEQNAGRDIMGQIMDKLNKWIPTLISGIAAIQYNTANSNDTAMKEDARRTREEADKMNKNISNSNKIYSSKIMVGG